MRYQAFFAWPGGDPMSLNGRPGDTSPDQVWEEIKSVFQEEVRPLFPREVVSRVLGRTATSEQEVRLLLISMEDDEVLHSDEDLRLVYTEEADTEHDAALSG